MSGFKQYFTCCFPKHTNNAIINTAEEKIDFDSSQITTVISKKEDLKSRAEGKNRHGTGTGSGTSKNQSLLCTQGTAIFNVSAIPKPQSITPPTGLDQMEPYPSNRVITPEQIYKAPTLTVKSISDKNLFTDNKIEIIINAGGLQVGGTRKEKDGVVFFGIPNKKENKDAFALDVQLQNINYSIENNDSINSPCPFLFVIYYNKETNGYQIKFALEGTSMLKNVFIKLAPKMEIPIIQPEILSLGAILLCITPCDLGQLEISIVNNQLSRKTFCSLDKIVTIGRAKTCSYCFDDLKGFSKIQSTLYYNEDKKYWILKDGSDTQNSKNGTWLFGLNSYQICSDLLIEVCRSQMLIIVND